MFVEDKRKVWLIWRILVILLNIFAATLYISVFIWSEIRHYKPVNSVNSKYYTGNSTVVVKKDIFGQWKFLTRWNHVIQAITFVCALLPNFWFVRNKLFSTEISISEESTAPQTTHFQTIYLKIFDTCFHSLTVPVALNVTFLYWTLRAINPSLVINPANKTPAFIDHAIHSAITPIALLELIFAYHQRPKVKHGLIVSYIFFSSYVIFSFTLGIVSNVWVYGILARLNWAFRVLFIIGCAVVMLVFYAITASIHILFWSEQRKNYFLTGKIPSKEDNLEMRFQQNI